MKDVYNIRAENNLKGKQLGLLDDELQQDDKVPTLLKITRLVRSLNQAFAWQGVMEMDSGMDCPLVQIFKRKVHKENEVTASS